MWRITDRSSRAAQRVNPFWVLPFCLGLLSGCAALGGGEDEQTPAPMTVATVGDDAISVAEVDDRIRDQLFRETFDNDPDQLYEARRATLDQMVDERLLERAAADAGQNVAQYLEEAIAALPPIDEAEVQALYDQNRDRLPADATLETFAPQIRKHLEGQRANTVLSNLREASAVEIALPRERKEVEAIGPSLGPADAPITIVEFSDFQCPFCAKAIPTLKALHAHNPDDVRIVYRHLPLGFHSEARIAALASICADAQESFWEYHDLLFENQKALKREQLIGYATDLALDIPQFETCLDDEATAAKVEADRAAAAAVGATGTPTFFVNGLRLTGAQPLENFQVLIEEERSRLAEAP